MSDAPESYRDRIATVDDSGKRVWIYPRKPRGNFYNARIWVSYLLLVILFLLPFIKVDGRPVLLLNIIERKFIVFGIGFWPQDFHLFALSFITFIVFIILFTVVFGRLFCGWACPQTIFMEMLFRRIEYWIEGDSHRQRKLDAQPWNAEKIRKKILKHAVFYALSFCVGNIFLSYIIGADALKKIIMDPVGQHLSGFVAMILFSFVFYGVFARFREQVCVMVCPYGRLQGVLLDRDSIVVSYDERRGEPRGIAKKGMDSAALGDCIDCGLCVEVCPTGIDIRNGTQLECINCTACMDACDGVMKKLKRPLGLVRYGSHNSMSGGGRHFLTPRVAGYSVVLVVLLSLVGYLLTQRLPIETTVLRMPGSLYQKAANGFIQNVYNVQVVNKSFEDRQISFHVRGFDDAVIRILKGDSLSLVADGLTESVLFVQIPEKLLRQSSEPLVISVYDGEKWIEDVATNFKTAL